MHESKWKIKFGIGLIFLSAVLYFIHYLIFHDAHHMFLFLVEDIAFIPIEVLIVSLILHKVIEEKEKEKIMDKLNMLIGVFFSEVGTKLLNMEATSDPQNKKLCNLFCNIETWTDKDFENNAKLVKEYGCKIEIEKINIENLAKFLKGKRNFMIGLLQNPYLLEHDTFTELLRTVFHLEDELHHHMKYDNLNKEDLSHLKTDMERVYPLLVYEWTIYMKYIKNNHPYLFSLALRDNPFK